MSLLEEQVAQAWIGYMKMVTGVVKVRLLWCIGQVLKQGLYQE
jgi:hypothetical protein